MQHQSKLINCVARRKNGNSLPSAFKPCHVKYVTDKYPVRVCTVIGFPLGATTTSTKLFECQQALSDGAQEIDMVINIGQVKNENYAYVQSEIEQLAKLVHASGENKVLKVIIETCLLNDNEKTEIMPDCRRCRR